MSKRKRTHEVHHVTRNAANDRHGRRAVLAALGALGVGAAATMALQRPASLQTALGVLEDLPATDPLPVVFVGHGTPFSVIDPNVWTEQWSRIGPTLPRPAAILMISAHWLTRGASLVTASAAPAMNYDISGFPQPIYEFTYPAPGHPGVAREVERALQGQTHVEGDTSWGLDHGTWLPLKYMFPAADIPVLQLSIDYGRPPAFHYELAKRLRTLRSKGVLIIGSGNVVHNLGERGGTGVTETPRDWAIEFDKRMASAVASGRHSDAIDFLSLGPLAQLAHPTYDHFLPFLYALGLVEPGGQVRTFCEGFQWPGISMRSFVLA
jgi:4,5-DOPA dioxygenase extradiol